MAVNYRAWTLKQKFNKVLLYVFMIAMGLFFLFPLYYSLVTAIKPLDELMKFPPDYYARRPTLQNFTDLFGALDGSSVPFVRYLFNSVFTTVITVFLTLIVSTLGAYGLVKHRVLFGKFWFTVIMIALMFSPTVTQIPSYVVINALGIENSYWVMIIPKIAAPFYFFLVKQFIEQLPNPLLEAARIDGANEIVIFWKIVLPFLKPAIATVTVFSFTANWNDSSISLLYITNDSLKTVPYILSSLGEGSNLTRTGALGAAAFLMLIPTILVFVVMQKNVVETMVHSGIK